MNSQQILNMILNNAQVKNNPLMSNAIGMYQNGNSKGLEELARNLCKEKGVNVDEFLKSLGINVH